MASTSIRLGTAARAARTMAVPRARWLSIAGGGGGMRRSRIYVPQHRPALAGGAGGVGGAQHTRAYRAASRLLLAEKPLQDAPGEHHSGSTDDAGDAGGGTGGGTGGSGGTGGDSGENPPSAEHGGLEAVREELAKAEEMLAQLETLEAAEQEHYDAYHQLVRDVMLQAEPTLLLRVHQLLGMWAWGRLVAASSVLAVRLTLDPEFGTDEFLAGAREAYGAVLHSALLGPAAAAAGRLPAIGEIDISDESIEGCVVRELKPGRRCLLHRWLC